jgi:hypothetical protein
MSAYLLVFNPTSSPQHTDDEGRVLGAGEFGPALRSSSAVKDSLAAGRLVEAQVGDDHVDPAVRKELDRLDELEARHASFTSLDDARLHRLGAELELDDGVRSGGKADLVHALTMHPSAKVPAKSSAAKEA